MDNRARVTFRRARLNLLLTIFAIAVVVIANGAQSAGSSLPTRAVTLPGGEIAYWLAHGSATTQILYDGSSRDKHRIIRWGSGGLYADTRRTYAVLGFRMVTGQPGRMYNWHTQPNDVGGWTPPCSHGVSPVAIDYWNDSRGLHVVTQPEDGGCGGADKIHFAILSHAEMEARRGKWVWLWAEITWGRRDLATKGAVKVWVAGEQSPRVDVSGINTHWAQEEMVTFWEGQYHSSGNPGASEVEIAATRFGRTSQEAYADTPALYRAEPAGNHVSPTSTGGSSTAIEPRISTEAAVPTSLNWEAAAPPPPPPNPKLNVKKVVVGDSTSPSAFSFAVSNGGGTHTFEADGQNELTLPAGTYSVSEPTLSGWTTTYAGCSNVVLSTPQATVPTCTITNTKMQAPAPSSPPKDTTPPTAPPGLTVAEASAKSVSLAWSPSTDDVGVVEYGVYRDNELIASQAELTATLSKLRCGTSYEIAVDATDAAGNRSEKTRTAVSTNTCAAAPSDKPGAPGKPEKPDNPDKPNHPQHPESSENAVESTSADHPTGLEPNESPENAVESTSADHPTGLEPNESPTGPGDSSRVDLSTPPRAARPTVDGPQAPTPSGKKEDRYSRPRIGLQPSPGRSWPSLPGLLPAIPNVFDVLGPERKSDMSRWVSWTFRPFAADERPLRWDGRTFHSRGAIKLHMDWSGRNYELWVRQHRRAFERLPA